MAQFREREEDENDGVPVDLKQKVCPLCRRKVQPWEAICPEDGSTPVEGVEMGAVEDGILARLNPDLLADLDDEPDAPDEPHVPDEDEPTDAAWAPVERLFDHAPRHTASGDDTTRA